MMRIDIIIKLSFFTLILIWSDVFVVAAARMEGLEGSKKGDTLKGINEVKKYLNMHGYLDKYEGLNDDYFDETLEAAVMTFQHFTGSRNLTGALYHYTYLLLTHPRCGTPDLIRSQVTERASTFPEITSEEVGRISAVKEGLEGRKKCDIHLKGISEVKKYLNRYGYLDIYEGLENDNFDDELETAIEFFQLYNSITKSGILDSHTFWMLTNPKFIWRNPIKRGPPHQN